MKKIICLSLASLICSPSFSITWDYTKNGPATWPDVCQTGKNQSPVNISTTIKGNLPEVNFNYLEKAQGEVINNGHSIQFDLKTPETIKIANKSYTLVQLHFHSPSENTINGKKFPLEMHLVHKDAKGNLAVVAVMFEQGDSNPALSQLWSVMPTKTNGKATITDVDLNQLLPRNKGYYGFNGSLTTPPCTEGVLWIVMKDYLTLSADNLKAFNNLYNGNARPVQPLNARYILNK